MEYCKLCEKAVGSKERRLLASISSERVLRCLQELRAASGSTATLLGDEHAQRAFVCRPCFAETEKYLRLSEEVERVRNSLCEKLFTKLVLHVIFDVSAPNSHIRARYYPSFAAFRAFCNLIGGAGISNPCTTSEYELHQTLILRRGA